MKSMSSFQKKWRLEMGVVIAIKQEKQWPHSLKNLSIKLERNNKTYTATLYREVPGDIIDKKVSVFIKDLDVPVALFNQIEN